MGVITERCKEIWEVFITGFYGIRWVIIEGIKMGFLFLLSSILYIPLILNMIFNKKFGEYFDKIFYMTVPHSHKIKPFDYYSSTETEDQRARKWIADTLSCIIIGAILTFVIIF